jgi:GT2 family glycosyltransferase
MTRLRIGKAEVERDTPAVTIAFPTRNRISDLQVTLQAIREVVSLPYEVIILDNSDVPTTLDLAANEYYHFMGENRGTVARNRAIELARAPFLLMLDDDSHPLPGAVEAGVSALRDAPPHVAGLMAAVFRRDGSLESALLPTVMLGCGVLLRTQVLRRLPLRYPEAFVFYGEEYWLTLSLYGQGYELQHCLDLEIVHRVSLAERSKERMLYYLTRNNDAIWEQFCPHRYCSAAIADTRRRYELIAGKEGEMAAYRRGQVDRLAIATSTPVSHEQFERFALIKSMRDAIEQAANRQHVVLCGTGKFPSLWARDLRQYGGCRVVTIGDTNPGLMGQTFGCERIESPKTCIGAADVAVYLVGHSSAAETATWKQMLSEAGIPFDRIQEIAPIT